MGYSTIEQQSFEDVNTCNVLNPVFKLDKFHLVDIGQQIMINGKLYKFGIYYAGKNANIGE